MTDASTTMPRSTSDLVGSASDVVAGAMDGLSKGAEVQKNAGADAMAGFARAVRDTAGNLEETSPQIARAVRTSADGIVKISDDIRSKNVDELLSATASFARRQPYVFLGLGVLAGLVLARALTQPR